VAAPVQLPIQFIQHHVGQHGRQHAMDTKDNFVFERRIRLRRAMTILDLRRKR
jgi:hypothetical protein